MATTVTFLAAAILLLTLLSTIDLWRGIRSMIRLSSVPPLPPQRQPKVSVIVAACNEEGTIAQAMTSLLALDYAQLEIIAINDRSTDNTGTILNNLAARHPQLRVVNIDHLPPEWMGKAHALHQGAGQAGGEFLLFTDADVILEKTALARAMSLMLADQRDHLAVIFKNSSPGWLLNCLILEAGASLLQLFRPWRAKDPTSSGFIGVGAFNLVKKSCYLAIGGHRTIAMHPVDDLMLGRLIKQHGYAQECLLGPDLVTVPWYSNVGAMVDGLMKNGLALVNYRLWLVLPVVLLSVTMTILPPWAALFSEGWTAGLFLATVVLRITAFVHGCALLAMSPWCALGALLSPYLTNYILIKAAWTNTRDGGIYWRGTFYPIARLKKNEWLLSRLVGH